MTPLICGSNKVQIILDEPLRENDVLFINLFNNPDMMMGVNENSEKYNLYFNKIDDLTYELTEEFINIVSSENLQYSIFGLKEESQELIENNGYLVIDCASYIINTTLKYYEIPDVSLPMELDKEYIVKGELKDGIYSLPYGLFSNEFNNSSPKSLDGTSDTNSNNIYCGQFINLIEINIPKNISEISNSVFSNNISLKNVTFESNNKLEYIGDNAFSFCYSLSEITIPNSVTSIGDYAFYNCSSLSSITFEEGSILNSISDGAFAYCTSLTSIDIPNSVTSIGTSAFQGCNLLKSVIFEEGSKLTSIGTNAFIYCYSLKSITIPSGVTSIGASAFRDCPSLSEITCLAETEPNIYSYTFRDICSNGVLYYPQNSNYSGWLSTSSYYLGKYKWVGIELQDTYDFKVNFITNGVRVDSPYNSLSINGIQGDKQEDNSYLFSGLQPMNGCYKFDLIANGVVIDRVDIKHKNKWITVGDNSSMLTCIYKPCQNTNIYSGSNLTYSSAYIDGVYKGTLSSSYTFNDVSEHIIQYSGVNSIGNEAFDNCRTLTSITIPNSVTSIGNYAFYKCYSLTSIDIPNSVMSIGYGTFNSCYSLSSITFEEGSILNSISENIFSYCYSLSEITIPYGVESIGNEAFRECFSLSSITIPNSVTSIGSSVFINCSSLSEITFEEGLILNSIGYDVFSNCRALTSIDIPNGVISIGYRAFSGCTSLTNITIPNSVNSIGYGTFSNCSSLSSITFEEGSILNSIDNETFSGCTSLTNITIPNSITSIGTSAFQYCSSLSSIIFEEGSILNSISDGAFAYCYSLSNITIPNSVNSIGNAVFRGCFSLTSIEIPNGVTEIGDEAFENCYSLKSVIFEEGSQCTSIGYDAFQNCYSLREITIGNNVTSIGEYAFTKCTSLSSITIPNSVTSIGDNAFGGCSSLSSITLPDSVTSINDYAFYGCTSLSEITCLAETAPTVSSNTFTNISTNGVVYYPGLNSSYDDWKQYLPNWDFVSLYTPQECTNLVISAKNVNCKATSTTISYTATTNGVDNNGNVVSGVELTGTAISEPFSQNTDAENEVIRTITFEYMGATASTTITQGVWKDISYSIGLNNQWQLSTSITNPDSSLYDGVYESFSNKGVDSSAAICTITINGYENFKLYVRSNGESCCDYVVVSNLDCTLNSGTTSGTSVKMTTKGKSISGTAITDYILVEFSGVDGGKHTIQVMYQKDGSQYNGTDQGYLLIPKEQ